MYVYNIDETSPVCGMSSGSYIYGRYITILDACLYSQCKIYAT